MTNNNRFDAALRAHVFHRPLSEGEEGAAPPAALPSNRATPEPRSQDYASELEAALMRDLNTLATGLRPRKLLPDRGSPPAPAVPAAAGRGRSQATEPLCSAVPALAGREPADCRTGADGEPLCSAAEAAPGTDAGRSGERSARRGKSGG